MRRNLGPDDLGDLLERPILAVLATHRRDGTMLLSPVWHEWADGGFSIAIWADDVKSRNIRNDPRFTLLVAEPDPPYRGFELSGEARIEVRTDPMPLMRRLGARYVGGQKGIEYAETFQGVDLEVIRLDPGAIRAWDFADEVE